MFGFEQNREIFFREIFPLYGIVHNYCSKVCEEFGMGIGLESLLGAEPIQGRPNFITPTLVQPQFSGLSTCIDGLYQYHTVL